MPLVLLSVNTESPFYNGSVFPPPPDSLVLELRLSSNMHLLLCCFMSEQFDLFYPPRPDVEKKKEEQFKAAGSSVSDVLSRLLRQPDLCMFELMKSSNRFCW